MSEFRRHKIFHSVKKIFFQSLKETKTSESEESDFDTDETASKVVDDKPAKSHFHQVKRFQ